MKQSESNHRHRDFCVSIRLLHKPCNRPFSCLLRTLHQKPALTWSVSRTADREDSPEDHDRAGSAAGRGELFVLRRLRQDLLCRLLEGDAPERSSSRNLRNPVLLGEDPMTFFCSI